VSLCKFWGIISSPWLQWLQQPSMFFSTSIMLPRLSLQQKNPNRITQLLLYWVTLRMIISERR